MIHLDNNNHMPPTLFDDLKIIFQVIRRRSFYPIPVYKYGIRDSMDRKYDQVIGELRSSIKRIIEEYDPAQYKQNSSRMSTMLESLWIAAQDEETQSAASGMATASKAAKRVTIDDVIGNLITAIVAGYGKCGAMSCG
jgi:cytochrome P450